MAPRFLGPPVRQPPSQTHPPVWAPAWGYRALLGEPSPVALPLHVPAISPSQIAAHYAGLRAQ